MEGGGLKGRLHMGASRRVKDMEIDFQMTLINRQLIGDLLQWVFPFCYRTITHGNLFPYILYILQNTQSFEYPTSDLHGIWWILPHSSFMSVTLFDHALQVKATEIMIHQYLLTGSSLGGRLGN